jgi:diguanylate cyclase (GGDEF)-like protein
MLSKPTTTARASGLRPGNEERQALARLSFALAHVLRLYRHVAAASGRPTDDLVTLEAALSAAQLPEDYVDVARNVSTLTGVAVEGAPSLSAHVHARFAAIFRDIARALSLTKLEEEIIGLAATGRDGRVDPDALLSIARRIVQSLLVHQSTTEILDESLKNVDGGIRRMAADEVDVGARLSLIRERLVTRPAGEDVDRLRRALVEETVSLERLVQERRRALEELQRQSRMAQRRAERLLSALADATTAACTDPLTGLGNRRAMGETIARIAISPSTTGVLVLDVDHFKRVNDTFGHAGGDRVLCQIAEAMRSELRPDDSAFRIGGEEFVVLLARCDDAGAMATAERIRQRIASTSIPVGATRIAVSASVGVALWTPGRTFEETHDAADEALYQAKNGGRNRCVAA